MLAEPKRRTIWSLNPRGKQWSDDKSKFGQKLLESMGWREGLGLGRDQNGIREHIKVTVNSENEGLGYKRTSEDVWIDKNNDYEELLANLAVYHNNGSNRVEKVSNLEEMSKKMRNRVHYHKLIKSKNLSQCSQKDLNSIIPKKRHISHNQKINVFESNGREQVVEDNSSDNTFKSNKSIEQYFRNKIKEKLKFKSELSDKINSMEIENKDNEECEECEPIAVLSEDCFDTKDRTEKRHEFSKHFGETDKLKNTYKKKLKKNKRKTVENNGNSLEKTDFDFEINSELNEEISEKTNDSNEVKIESNDVSNERSTEREAKEVSEKCLQLTNGYSKKFYKKAEKNIEKYKIRVPKGYDKWTASVNESLRNYPKICAAIAKDRALSTTNLIVLKGYGCDSD